MGGSVLVLECMSTTYTNMLGSVSKKNRSLTLTQLWPMNNCDIAPNRGMGVNMRASPRTKPVCFRGSYGCSLENLGLVTMYSRWRPLPHKHPGITVSPQVPQDDLSLNFMSDIRVSRVDHPFISMDLHLV